jgi:hypothetical protein
MSDTDTPLPPDAPLLSLGEAAAYLRMTVVALRAVLEKDKDDFSNRLRGMMVCLSERRRYIKREPFMAWLNQKA